MKLLLALLALVSPVYGLTVTSLGTATSSLRLFQSKTASGSTTPAAATAPAVSPVINNLLVASVNLGDTSTTITTPVGWTLAGSKINGTSASVTLFYRLTATADLTVAPVFSAVLSANPNWVVCLAEFQGTSTSSVFDAAGSGTNISGSSTNFNPAGVATAASGRKLVIEVASAAANRTFTTLSGYSAPITLGRTGSGGGMAWGLEDNTTATFTTTVFNMTASSASTGASNTYTFNIPDLSVTGATAAVGDLIAVFYAGSRNALSSPTYSASDDGSNTYSAGTEAVRTGSLASQLLATTVSTALSSGTVKMGLSATGSCLDRGIEVVKIQPGIVGGGNPLDAPAAATGTDTAPTVSVTPTVLPNVLIGAIAYQPTSATFTSSTATVITADTDIGTFSSAGTGGVFESAVSLSTAYRVATALSATAVGGALSTATAWTVSAAGLKQASVPRQRVYTLQ